MKKAAPKQRMTAAEFRAHVANGTLPKKKKAKAFPKKPVNADVLGDSVIVTLPYPPAELSPNYAGHWRPKAKAKKWARDLAKATVAEYAAGRQFNSYQIHFAFPDLARRDLDNATGRCKAYLDGIADAVGQDDSEWGMEAPTRDVCRENPRVIITLNEKEGA